MIDTATNVLGGPLLRIREAASVLRSSDKTVRRLIVDGKLPSVKVRGLRLIRATDLRSLIEASTH